jgi:hypothetical protein
MRSEARSKRDPLVEQIGECDIVRLGWSRDVLVNFENDRRDFVVAEVGYVALGSECSDLGGN